MIWLEHPAPPHRPFQRLRTLADPARLSRSVQPSPSNFLLFNSHSNHLVLKSSTLKKPANIATIKIDFIPYFADIQEQRRVRLAHQFLPRVFCRALTSSSNLGRSWLARRSGFCSWLISQKSPWAALTWQWWLRIVAPPDQKIWRWIFPPGQLIWPPVCLDWVKTPPM